MELKIVNGLNIIPTVRKSWKVHIEMELKLGNGLNIIPTVRKSWKELTRMGKKTGIGPSGIRQGIGKKKEIT